MPSEDQNTEESSESSSSKSRILSEVRELFEDGIVHPPPGADPLDSADKITEPSDDDGSQN